MSSSTKTLSNAVGGGAAEGEQPPAKKTRKTRWGQTAPEGVPVASSASTVPTPSSLLPGSALGHTASTLAAVLGNSSSSGLSSSLTAMVPSATTASTAMGYSSSGLVKPSPQLIASVIAARTGLPSSTIVPSRTTSGSGGLSSFSSSATPGLIPPSSYQLTNAGASRTGGLPTPRQMSSLVAAGLSAAAAARHLPSRLLRPPKFDRLGREVDEEGKVISVKPLVLSTLKVNINKNKEMRLKEAATLAKTEKGLTDPSKNIWFDPNLSIANKARRKGLCFVEEGYYSRRERQMINKAHAKLLGVDNSLEGKEARRKRQAEEEMKLKQLLLQHPPEKSRTNDGDENGEGDHSGDKEDDEEGEGEEFNPNLIPLGGGGSNTSTFAARQQASIAASAKTDSNLDIDDDRQPGSSPVDEAGDDDEESPISGGINISQDNNKLSKSNNSSNSHLDDDLDEDSLAMNRQQPLSVLQRKQRGLIPEVEWWDSALLKKVVIPDAAVVGKEARAVVAAFPYVVQHHLVTNLIEHPIPIPPAVDVNRSVIPAVHLTPKERATLRRRRRQDNEKEKQDKIRMGLLVPPPPKVKLGNLARVLGTTAAADPSKVERQVRAQMAKRIKDHEARNEARKLDPETRRTKKINKWVKSNETDIPDGGARVVAFYVRDLSDRKTLFKVDKNAQQYHLSGAAVICPGLPSLVLVEGANKALKGYKKLMLRRINWAASAQGEGNEGDEVPEEPEEPSEDENTVAPPRKELDGKRNPHCKLLWEGVVKERSFKQWKVHVCKTESEARKVLSDKQAEHYWDMLRKFRDPAADL